MKSLFYSTCYYIIICLFDCLLDNVNVFTFPWFDQLSWKIKCFLLFDAFWTASPVLTRSTDALAPVTSSDREQTHQFLFLQSNAATPLESGVHLIPDSETRVSVERANTKFACTAAQLDQGRLHYCLRLSQKVPVSWCRPTCVYVGNI